MQEYDVGKSAQKNKTSEERGRRLENDRVSTRNARTRETSEERGRRLENNRVSTRNARTQETSEERGRRLENDRVSTRNARTRETSEERGRRLENNRVSTRNARTRETSQERRRRLEENRASTSQARLHLWQDKENSAFMYNPSLCYASDPLIEIGGMATECISCQALKWKGETPSMCCSNGKIKLCELQTPPEPLLALLTDSSIETVHFQSNIRRYNSCFQMTSFGSGSEIREQGFMPTFKVQGQVYHRIGSLQPQINDKPNFLQLYFVGDQEKQSEQRCRNVLKAKQALVSSLQEMLHEHNNYVRSFKLAMEKMTPELKVIIQADKTPVGQHERRFNAPNTSEVAVILAGDVYSSRDIVLELKSNEIKKIAETHRAYDALQYPLMFWQGEDGYHFELRQELFNQFIVDMFAKIESERLRFVRLNQKKLRVEEYVHLKDALNRDGSVHDIGKMVILPSTFTGGPRYMHERTQDAMTYVRNYGKPDLFITFTCNPQWQEVTNELMPRQRSHDRHDLLARVFHLKLRALMILINKGKVFGSVQCFMYTIEWQKRGLPHAHILIWLHEKIHVHSIDNVISAEIPDPKIDPVLHDVIKTQMIHGPCGILNQQSPCMKDGKCTKRYPRNFLKETQTGEDGYPLYRRQSPEDGGYTTVKKVRSSDIVIDNRWVVPFCPLLSKTFNAHINVEFCNSIKSIKYVCKYVNKGSDMAVFNIANDESVHDEVQHYEIGRYISSNEAVWRILGFPIHERHPTVVHLSVHLENGQRVYFTSENARERAQAPPVTTLTSFFSLCQNDDFAHTLLYNQLPKYYTWSASSKKWVRWKSGQIVSANKGIKSSDAPGRVYTIHPNNSECFHLRLLLHEVHGPTSFNDLKTFGEIKCETFKQACLVRELLENDSHWKSTLEEAVVVRSPEMLRNLFAIMLQTCSIANLLELWNLQRENMLEDVLHQARIRSTDMDSNYDDAIFNQALILLENKVKELGGSGLKTYGLPLLQQTDTIDLNREILRATNYNTDEMTSYIDSNEPNLVQDQKEALEKILFAVFNDVGGIFFVDAPGGTGKTYLINLILAKVRQRNKIALAVASSGIAATLLSGGRTAHSVFKLPLNLSIIEHPTCNISRSSDKADVLRRCKLKVWDECTMSHKAALEALDNTMQDLLKNNKCMGVQL
nr:uncharacterized protein LOC107440395 [Parasteatoda tepidariorum]